MSISVSRRNFLGLGMGAAAAFGLAGCAAFTPKASKPSGKLEVAFWGGADRAKLYQSAVDVYTKRNPEVQATVQFADNAPYFERLTTAAAAGNLPDVFWMVDTNIGRYAEAGALMDLKKYIGGSIKKDGIGDAGVEAGSNSKGVFGLPTHYNSQAILTDNDVLAAKGVPFAEVKTWEDLAAAAKELTDSSAGFYGLLDPTMGTSHRGLEAWVRQSGGELFTDEGKPGFDESLLGDWLDYWAKMRNAGTVPSAAAQTESDSAGWTSDLMVKSKAAIRLASASHLGVVKGLRKGDIGLNSYAVAAGASDDWWFFTPILLCVSARTGNADVAADMVNYFINDSEAAGITQVSMGTPSVPDVAKSLTSTLKEDQALVVKQVLREMENKRRRVPLKPEGSDKLNSALTRVGQEIAYGRSSVADGAKSVIADSVKYLKS